jgi:hypothetical protein
MGDTDRTRVGHCKADDTDVYAGRGPNGRHMLSVGKPGERGWLGNPFTLEDHHRGASIAKFREAFEEKLERDAEFREAVGNLSGKILGCWCQRLDDEGPPCHAEIIAEYADRIASEQHTDADQSDHSQEPTRGDGDE